MAWFDRFAGRSTRAGEVELFARTGGDPAQGRRCLLAARLPADARDVAPRRARARAPTSRSSCPTCAATATRPSRRRRRRRARPRAAQQARDGRRHGGADALARPRALRRASATTAAAASRTGSRSTIPSGSTGSPCIDIVPTLDMYEATDMRFASWYYHWFFLIQPAPLPERMIGADPGFYLRWTLGALGRRRRCGYIEPEALAEYERCFCRADTIHAACEDYRASASIDLEHDRASRAAGEKIACDRCSCCGASAASSAASTIRSALWRAQCAATVEGARCAAGHFIPEELPDETGAARLRRRLPAPPSGEPSRVRAGPRHEVGPTIGATPDGRSVACSAGSTGSTTTSRSATRPGRCASSRCSRARSPGRGWAWTPGWRRLRSAWSLVGVHDLRQTRHAILRNYPVIGHLRFLLEFIRPEMRQYFIESDNEAAPFSRAAALAGLPARQGRARQAAVRHAARRAADGYEWINHSMQPTDARDARLPRHHRRRAARSPTAPASSTSRR